ncbi:protein mono-ADP-ribosyltransferase PARP14-like [Saccostrea echinata]|uniref:protein mono-ADP-ribosyltransferase PARP14-like n=1 Tax=Saccostrea echinata TaxID=191078 RepID=UPI002A83EFF4|nr:protein mono-ADP-ribosyltransferase PARP14-like [Saccostrea echinata]
MHEYGMAVTANGDKSKLPSKYIIHVNLAGGNYKRKIMSVFQKAEEMGMKTIALPALGTGQQSFHQRKIEDFAQEVFDGLNRMSSDVKNLTEVHVIIFDHQQAVQFIVEMEKCFESQGSKPKGWFKGMVDAFKYYVTGGKSDGSGQWKPVLTDKPDDQSSVTIVVFADNQKNLDAGLRKLENLVNADFKTRDIRDSAIPHLSLEQMKALKNLEDEFDVEINIDRDGGIVTLLGTSESLLDATSYVKDMLRNVDRNKLEAEYVSDVVMWYYVDNSDGKNELCDYPKNINLLVEKAYSNKQPDVKFLDVQGTQYTIDFSSMVEYPSDDPTDVLTVTRRDKIKASTFEPPPEWTAMSESENLVVIQVPSGSQEYLKVIDRFQGELQTSGIKSDIIKLERIQNKMLYQQYVAKKKLLDSQNPPGTKNERELWHGTAPEAVNSVNSLGFNRSYCGKNAAVHGNGVYFAVDAEYSARETYSKPDPNGHKRIYLCKVLTGEFTLGKKDMRVPPPKDVNQPHILYDSVVYPLQDPEMFIIFNDTQGYPSYLITFIKTK